MGALALGALAALGWGLHDLCVRRISRRAHIPSCLLVVLLVGVAAQLPLLALPGEGAAGELTGGQASGQVGDRTGDRTGDQTGGTSALAILAPRTLGALLATGTAFAVASYAMYRAFAVGPVRLVAPLIGAYPIATTAFAAFGGASFGVGHWLALAAVIAGVALVAAGADGDGAGGGAGRDTSADTDASPPDGDAAAAATAHDPPAGAPPEAFALAPILGWSLLSAFAFATTFSLGQGLAARLDPGGGLARHAAGRLSRGRARRRGEPRVASAEPRRAAAARADGACSTPFALGAVLLAGRLPEAVLASVTASLFGVVTIVLARVLLAEAMSVRQWTGVGVAFAAIGWLSAA